ncbi:hypothetical protein [Lancefieldella rimae]|uniref:hypothetical protein n=1 Tax=Lancefieldella rimae TaxID=1383 RepID=UPI0028E413D1|nr:hypothetical protein [Lancefieldella rimae]
MSRRKIFATSALLSTSLLLMACLMLFPLIARADTIPEPEWESPTHRVVETIAQTNGTGDALVVIVPVLILAFAIIAVVAIIKSKK